MAPHKDIHIVLIVQSAGLGLGRYDNLEKSVVRPKDTRKSIAKINSCATEGITRILIVLVTPFREKDCIKYPMQVCMEPSAVDTSRCESVHKDTLESSNKDKLGEPNIVEQLPESTRGKIFIPNKFTER